MWNSRTPGKVTYDNNLIHFHLKFYFVPGDFQALYSYGWTEDKWIWYSKSERSQDHSSIKSPEYLSVKMDWDFIPGCSSTCILHHAPLVAGFCFQSTGWRMDLPLRWDELIFPQHILILLDFEPINKNFINFLNILMMWILLKIINEWGKFYNFTRSNKSPGGLTPYEIFRAKMNIDIQDQLKSEV